MNVKQLLLDIKSGKYAPFYFLYGDEPFFIDQIVQCMEETIIPAPERSFGLHIVYAKEETSFGIMQKVKNIPLSLTKQLIIVKEAQELPDLKQKPVQELWINYATHLSPVSILVFAYKQKSLPSSRKLSNALKSMGVCFESKKMYDNQVPKWIVEAANDKGIGMNNRAASLLFERIGNNLSRLSNELDKIHNAIPKSTLSENDIIEYVKSYKEYDVFEFVSQVANRNTPKAMEILKFFSKDMKRYPPFVTVAMLFNHFSKLLILYQHKKKSLPNLAELTGLRLNSPFLMRDYNASQRNYSLLQTRKILSFIGEADMMLKGLDTAQNHEQVMTDLLIKINLA